MRRTPIVSARPNYRRRRAIAASIALCLALIGTYGLFLATCAFMLVLGLAA